MFANPVFITPGSYGFSVFPLFSAAFSFFPMFSPVFLCVLWFPVFSSVPSCFPMFLLSSPVFLCFRRFFPVFLCFLLFSYVSPCFPKFFLCFPVFYMFFPLNKCKPYNNISKKCNLCRYEKFIIICKKELCSLNVNRQNVLASSCPHRNRYVLHTSRVALFRCSSLNLKISRVK